MFQHGNIFFKEISSYDEIRNISGDYADEANSLKSEMDSAPSFFGRRKMHVVLMTLKLLMFSSEKELMMPMRSTLSIAQHEHRKVVEKPWGSGALFVGMSSISS